MTDKPCEHGASYNGVNCWRCLRVECETLRQENAELKSLLREALEMSSVTNTHDRLAAFKLRIREAIR